MSSLVPAAPSLSNSPNKLGDPVAVGALGGSGTRAVAILLQELGYFVGSDLNRALDNLWFTLLFKQLEVLKLNHRSFQARVDILRAAMTGVGSAAIDERVLDELAAVARVQHTTDWLRQRVQTLSERLQQAPPVHPQRWAWKEPNTHIVLERLSQHIPGMRYIHVVRDGLDMAFSRNHGQLSFWARELFDLDAKSTPRNQLRYWCCMHQRLDRIIERQGLDVFFLPYEPFCHDPRAWIGRLAAFIGAGLDDSQVDAMAARIETPASIGRHREHSLTGLEAEDVAYALAQRARFQAG